MPNECNDTAPSMVKGPYRETVEIPERTILEIRRQAVIDYLKLSIDQIDGTPPLSAKLTVNSVADVENGYKVNLVGERYTRGAVSDVSLTLLTDSPNRFQVGRELTIYFDI